MLLTQVTGFSELNKNKMKTKTEKETELVERELASLIEATFRMELEIQSMVIRSQ